MEKKCTKRGKGWKEREVENSVAFHTVCERNGVQKPKLQDVQLEARLDERRDCQRRQQKALPTTLTPSIFSSWISSNSSKRLTPPPSLSLLFDPFNDRGRGFHKEIIGLVHKWYDCRCNYRDVISYYLEISAFPSILYYIIFFLPLVLVNLLLRLMFRDCFP